MSKKTDGGFISLDTIVSQKIEEWSNSSYDGIWYGYSALSDETNIPVKQLKKICKKLRADGVIKLEPIYGGDGVICGSGYFHRVIHGDRLTNKQV